MKLTIFKEIDFLLAIKALFAELNVPVNYVTDEPTTARQILKDTYKDNSTFALVDDVYFVGMVDDAAFEGNESLSANQIKSDYDGVLIFGITLNQRDNNLLPTRSQLAEISRAFNREFYYTPVVLVFKYSDKNSDYLAFANTERLKYKQEWREGEKAGKVSLLRDINIKKPHRGHEDIINQLKIPTSGTKQVNSFAKLYNYWQEVFSVSILNKKFYQELQNWYFWAIKEVSFPNQPKILDENIDGDEAKLKEAIKEHKGKNVIRLLTRILFIWFIKEKKLIPEEIFDEQTIADKLIDDFTPQKPHGIFATGKHNSRYYRAILQNLFFATLNQEMGKRAFRNDKQHQNVTNLMRYKSYFKDPAYFVNLMEEVVPFMNGGLFECLDKPHPDKKGKQGGDIIIYTDGFSDRADNFLKVPDYLFFDVDEDVDLSDDFGSKAKVYKNAKTRGLLEILKSYKFTITENTPIEEDVALDPELLGKVFENLLASYNPETKTPARKQTGSFYTPREIVNYMVDESLIAYLKNAITDWDLPEEELDKNLHQLFSFDETNPFEDYPDLQKQIIKALDKAKILDPAVGSGAFPMGVLQKMVHVLQKLDPENELWKEVQLEKAMAETEDAFGIEDRKEREQKLIEINNAFDERINDPDFARKLYLIENCIYGVDIQSIATQISKLRFFISLIVDQKIDKSKPNFGVRPLPNLETKFVAANTLIGIDKPKEGEFTGSLFDNTEVKKLEAQLKKVRHKLFSSKSPKRKRELRVEDKNLREQIANLLEEGGMENKTARQLASWDPYDQNASSPFFNPEWMFDISDGFNIVIGNPPYIRKTALSEREKVLYDKAFRSAYKQYDLYILFTEKSFQILENPSGILCFINPTNFMISDYGTKMREIILKEKEIIKVLDVSQHNVFVSASTYPAVFLYQNRSRQNYEFTSYHHSQVSFIKEKLQIKNPYNYRDSDFYNDPGFRLILSVERNQLPILRNIENNQRLGDYFETKRGEPNSKVIFVDDGLKAIQSTDVKKDSVTPSCIVRFKRGSEDRHHHYIENDYIILPRTVLNIYSQRSNRNIILDRIYFLVSLRSINPSFIELVINSSVINFWFSSIYDSTRLRGGYFDLNGNQIKSIPVPINALSASSLGLLKKTEIKSVIDACIIEFFFSNHMKEREIDILKFVERDIEKGMQGRDIEQLSNTEKEQVIEQLHKTWTDPENEVVKRMAQFKEKSPDILKVIMES